MFKRDDFVWMELEHDPRSISRSNIETEGKHVSDTHHMDTLPNEIHAHILSYLPAEAFITSIKSVNKEYLRFTQHSVTEYKPAVQYEKVFGDAQLATLARDFPNITSLDVSACNSITTAGLKVILTKFPKLKSLALPRVRGQARQLFLDYKCPSVTRLDMRSMEYIKVYSHYQLGPNCDCGFVTDAFPNLEEVLIPPSESDVTNKIAQKNIRSLTVNPRYGNKIESESVVELKLTFLEKGMDIKDCPNLRVLSLQGTLTPKMLDSVPNLEKLILQTTTPMDPLINGLISNKWQNLTYLEFVYCVKLLPEQLQSLVATCQSVKKIVIKIPSYPTVNYLNVESAAFDLQRSQSRVIIVVVGGENRHKTLALSNRPLVIEHVIPSETSEDLTTCEHCTKSVKKCDLHDHYTICTEWPGWPCLLHEHGCHVRDLTRAQRLRHLKSCEFNAYHCIPCHVAGRMDQYARHFQNYHQRAEYLQTTSRVQCPNKALGCVAQATSPADLVQHMKKCTADQGQFICKSCDGNFESRTALCTHLAEECRGERKRQLVSEEGFVKLKQITDRILKEGKGYEGIGYSNIRHRLYSM